jgi:hypothetical protein
MRGRLPFSWRCTHLGAEVLRDQNSNSIPTFTGGARVRRDEMDPDICSTPKALSVKRPHTRRNEKFELLATRVGKWNKALLEKIYHERGLAGRESKIAFFPGG